jgi:hypothetical protein
VFNPWILLAASLHALGPRLPAGGPPDEIRSAWVFENTSATVPLWQIIPSSLLTIRHPA